MSDFLDRLAIRAIGHEPMLAPRLPSLFEAAQQVPVMPPHDNRTGERGIHHEAEAPVCGMKAAMRDIKPALASLELVKPLRRAVPRHDEATPAVPAPRAPSPALPSLVTIEPVRAPLAVDPPPSVTASAPLPPRPASTPVQPRELHVSSARMDPATPRAPVGVLVPAPPMGIAATRTADVGARARDATAAHQSRVAADSTRSLASEPVVHVSIGRIEVRAAPAIVAPARTREAARSGGLDDYLRRRGGKTPS